MHHRLAPVLTLLLAACSTVAPGMALAAEDAGADDTADTHLWPLLVNSREADGGRYLLLLGLYHRTTRADGSTASMHLFNYLDSPAFSAVLPVYYRYGQGARRHQVIAPFYLDGPHWWGVPPALTASWRRQEGGRSLWVTPLFHRDTHADGSLADMHCLTYARGDGYQVLVPLAYRVGAPGQEHAGILPPVWMSGPGWWASLPMLSAHWRTEDGGTATWWTPLAHVERGPDGRTTSWHALTVFHWDHSWLAAPVAGGGRGWWCVPAAMCGSRREPDGSRFTMITPLFHAAIAADHHLASMHLLTYIEAGDRYSRTQVALPLWYRIDAYGSTYQGLLPVFCSGPQWWVAPLFLSGGGSQADGSRTLWLSPAFHCSRSGDGRVRSLHALVYAQWQHGWMVAPVVAKGEGWWTAPLLLSAGWRSRDGSSHTWVTPLLHVDRDRDGALVGAHVLTYMQDRHGETLWPVAWYRRSSQGPRWGVLPAWLAGPGYAGSPALLSGRWHEDGGGHQLWLTPAFHRRSDDQGRITAWHVLNVVHAGRTTVVAPLAWSHHDERGTSLVVLPLVVKTPEHLVVAPLYASSSSAEHPWSVLVPLWVRWRSSWVAPLVLSAAWHGADGSRTIIATPLLHRTTAADGTVTSEHIGPYVQTTGFATCPPLYWSWRTADGGRTALLLPLACQHQARDRSATTLVLPPLVGYHRGATLLDSFAWHCVPFSAQSAGNGRELTIAWQLTKVRRAQGATQVWVSPLWWSEHRAGAPLAWQVLGGLVARNCDYRAHTSQASIFWVVPVGRRHAFAGTAGTAGTGEAATRSAAQPGSRPRPERA